MSAVLTGLEQFITRPPESVNGKRLGLLCNSASVNGGLVHARHLIDQRLPGQLKALFSPQHGFFAARQDNMIESDHGRDPILDIPVFSLYGETRIPTAEMLNAIDVLLIDLQDVGTRVYTFIYTMSYCLEQARRFDKHVVILDRPNPIGGRRLEGGCLDPTFASFVGRYPIPMRHGLTIGELARLFNDQFGIHCSLEVIPMSGWQRDMLWHDTGLPWVAPSPNLPTPTSAAVYPGQVIWEGTNISEGRGTTQPFELFGAPFIDPEAVLNHLEGESAPGVHLRPMEFEPTANKWSGQICRGFQLHITAPDRYRPYRTSLRLLQAIVQLYPDRFGWKQPPYEYEYERMPIDLILGDGRLRSELVDMTPMEDLEAGWRKTLDAYERLRQPLLLYP